MVIIIYLNIPFSVTNNASGHISYELNKALIDLFKSTLKKIDYIYGFEKSFQYSQKGWWFNSAVEHLPIMYSSLGAVPSTVKAENSKIAFLRRGNCNHDGIKLSTIDSRYLKRIQHLEVGSTLLSNR